MVKHKKVGYGKIAQLNASSPRPPYTAMDYVRGKDLFDMKLEFNEGARAGFAVRGGTVEPRYAIHRILYTIVHKGYGTYCTGCGVDTAVGWNFGDPAPVPALGRS